MSSDTLTAIIREQRDYFASGKTRDIDFRREQLKRLLDGVRSYEGRLAQAVKQDLGKSGGEFFTSEIVPVITEIKHALKHLNRWTGKRRTGTALLQGFATNYVQYQPLGVVCIISPWNYPVGLSLTQVVSAVAAGNTMVLKPSQKTPAVNSVLERLFAQYFDRGHVAMLAPGQATNDALLAAQFDMIHFTGSAKVGKTIMRAAAENLTPVVLELGGKSPVIVHNDADIDIAARRILWAKSLNAGQTCVAPDYMLVHESIKDQFAEKFRTEMRRMFGPNVANSPDYSRIISTEHFDRLEELMRDGYVLAGGDKNRDKRFIAPTLLHEVPEDAPVMQEEIFGPLLPVFTYRTLDEAIAFINKHPDPLALYVFTTDHSKADKVFNATTSGSAVMNDLVVHVANPRLPFGGVGQSGMGRSHGFAGFRAFSNERAISRGSNMIDLPMRYAPLVRWKMKVMRKLFK